MERGNRDKELQKDTAEPGRLGTTKEERKIRERASRKMQRGAGAGGEGEVRGVAASQPMEPLEWEEGGEGDFRLSPAQSWLSARGGAAKHGHPPEAGVNEMTWGRLVWSEETRGRW